jgi:hypothetical protein
VTDLNWINGSYADAMKMVVERALFSREMGGLTKQADLSEIGRSIGGSIQNTASGVSSAAQNMTSDVGAGLSGGLQSLLQNPHMRRALTGMAIGGGIGAMSGDDFDEYGQRRSRIGKMLRTALMGGVIGGGSGIAKNYLEQHPPDISATALRAKELMGKLRGGLVEGAENLSSSVKAAAHEAINQADAARRELGVLGVDENQLDPIMSKLRKGQLSSGRAISKAKDLVPGIKEQIRNLPGAVNVAAQQADVGNVAGQLDVMGLKNINPFAENFSPTTTAASIGLGTAGLLGQRNRHLHQALLGNLPGVPKEMASAFPQYTSSTGPRGASFLQKFLKPKDAARMTPGTMMAEAERRLGHATPIGRMGRFALPASLAALPLVAREWMGGGYRSGAKPIEQLAESMQAK